ncbi:MAG: hypothetical protein ACXADX_19765 [Candidatus Hodarchaeales archaeon]
MKSIWEKLNLKAEPAMLVMNAPPSFEPEIQILTGADVIRSINETSEFSFALVFVSKQDELDALSKAIAAKAKGDAVVWFAYPKKTSKRYKCDFNRDTGWHVIGAAGFEGVRQVAIDEDWSAIRFRKVEFIKSMRRDPKRAVSEAGKKKATEK